MWPVVQLENFEGLIDSTYSSYPQTNQMKSVALIVFIRIKNTFTVFEKYLWSAYNN